MTKKRNIPKEFIQSTEGKNNGAIENSIDRLLKGNTYRDLSTIWVTPTRGELKPKVVSSWMNLMKPMNQPFLGILFFEEDEVGIAYEKAFSMILEHPELSKWKYILTVEEDNLPPSDGLLRLYECIDKGYDVVGGLYWVKGEFGQPMIYGSVNEMPRNFKPQIPIPEGLQPCNGLGMGFNLWSIDSLKKKLKNMPKPWFRTVQEKGQQFTQDLWFYNEAAKHGLKVASANMVKVGHLDTKTGQIW